MERWMMEKRGTMDVKEADRKREKRKQAAGETGTPIPHTHISAYSGALMKLSG